MDAPIIIKRSFGLLYLKWPQTIKPKTWQTDINNGSHQQGDLSPLWVSMYAERNQKRRENMKINVMDWGEKGNKIGKLDKVRRN